MAERRTPGRAVVMWLGLASTHVGRKYASVRWEKVVLWLREHLVYMRLFDTKELVNEVCSLVHCLSAQYELRL